MKTACSKAAPQRPLPKDAPELLCLSAASSFNPRTVDDWRPELAAIARLRLSDSRHTRTFEQADGRACSTKRAPDALDTGTSSISAVNGR
jgi:hypothetical protein